MVIAFDYDGTITKDEHAFLVTIMMFILRKHTVLIVTQRSEEQGDDVKKFVDKIDLEHPEEATIIWSSGKAKQVAAIEAGHFVDVWVEDNPISIFEPLVYVGEGGNAAKSEETREDS